MSNVISGYSMTHRINTMIILLSEYSLIMITENFMYVCLMMKQYNVVP